MGYYTPQMITEKQYERIIACLKCGYLEHRPNLRIATILQITFNTGMNTEDIINMKPVDIRLENGIWMFFSDEGREFVIPNSIKNLIDEYYREKNGKEVNYSSKERIFGKITNAAVWKAVRLVTEYLGFEKIAPYSFRKRSIVRVFEASNYDEELLYEFLQSNGSSEAVNRILTALDGKERKYLGSNRV